MPNFSGKKHDVQSGEFELLPAGEYETVLSAEWKNDKQGNPYINCSFTIRKDIPEQKYGGRIVFDAIRKLKTTGDYDDVKIDGILSTVENPGENDFNFTDYDSVLQYINGLEMIIDVDVEPANQFHEKDKNVVKYNSYKKTAHPSGKAKESTSGNLPEVDTDSLPF